MAAIVVASPLVEIQVEIVSLLNTRVDADMNGINFDTKKKELVATSRNAGRA